MARITIEDCINVVGNRFRLVMYSAQRGREIAVEVDQLKTQKSAVMALQEIAQGHCDHAALEEAIIRNHRRYSPIESEQEQSEGEGETATSAVTSDERRARVTTSASVATSDSVDPDSVFSKPVKDISDSDAEQSEDKN